MSLLNPIEAAISPYAVWIKVGLYALAVVSLLGVGAYGGYRWEHGALVSLQLADAKAQTQAVALQAESDGQQAAVNLRAAVDEQAAQDRLHPVYVTITKEIHDHVSPLQDARVAAACGISVGFVRSLRAAESGVTPDTLGLATGQSDDDCADISASALADNVAQALGVGVENSEQLNALIQWIKDNHKAQVVK
jgi:hypothetical protein